MCLSSDRSGETGCLSQLLPHRLRHTHASEIPKSMVLQVTTSSGDGKKAAIVEKWNRLGWTSSR